MQDMLPIESALYRIDSYGAQSFTIRGETHEEAVLLHAHGVQPWEAQDVAHWQESDFAPLFNLAEPPEVLLLGTGGTHVFVPPALKRALKAKGINADSMDTGAACRTYNVLLSEGRRVAAALLLAEN